MPELFPIGSTTVTDATESQAVTFPSTWSFDSSTGEFAVAPNGKMVQVDETQAWYEWCINALDVERYKYLTHSRTFGHEMYELFRLNLDRKAFESEVKRIVSETLQVDPRTDRVEEFTFEWGVDTLKFSFVAHNAREEQVTISQSIATV